MPVLQYSTAFHNKSAAAFYKHVQNFVQSPPSNTVNPNFPFESLINCMANRLGSHVKMDGSAGVKAAWKYNQAILLYVKCKDNESNCHIFLLLSESLSEGHKNERQRKRDFSAPLFL